MKLIVRACAVIIQCAIFLDNINVLDNNIILRVRIIELMYAGHRVRQTSKHKL